MFHVEYSFMDIGILINCQEVDLIESLKGSFVRKVSFGVFSHNSSNDVLHHFMM